MYSQNDKEASLKLSYTLSLFGYFYLIIRLIAGCIIQYRHIGRRAFVSLQDSPALITLTNVTTAAMCIVAFVSICLALASRASCVRGLKNSSLFFLVLVFVLSFQHRILMYLMFFFLVFFYLYLTFSPYVRSKYPKAERKRSSIGRIAFLILTTYLLAFGVVRARDFYLIGRSIPLVTNSIALSEGRYTDGMLSFEHPREWSLDSLVYTEDSFPVSYFTDADSNRVCVYSSIMKDGGIDGHNLHVVMMCPRGIMSRNKLVSFENAEVNRNEVFFSRYLERDSLYLSLSTVFDRQSKKATTFLAVSIDSTKYNLPQLKPILETVSFDLKGDLLEDQSIQQIED